MLKITIGKFRHTFDDQRVFAVVPGGRAGVVDAAGFDRVPVGNDKFVVQGCIPAIQPNRNVTRRKHVDDHLAFAILVRLFIKHHANVNAARFCPDQSSGNIRDVKL